MRPAALTVTLLVLAGGCKPAGGRRATDGSTTQADRPDGRLLSRLARQHFASQSSRPTFSGGDRLVAFDEIRGRLKLSRRGDHRELLAEATASLFVRTAAGEDRVRRHRVRCLLRRRARGWQVRWCRFPDATGLDGGPLETGSSGTMGDDWVGIDECDRLLAFYRCYATRMPAASRASMEKAYRSMVKTYRTAATNPSARRALSKACATALKSLRKVADTNPQFRGCL